MVVDALAPGCSADKSGSVQVGDYVAAVDGKTDLSPTHAKEMILGRQGTYATISFRRPEGANVRTFKVQLMRGSADYIFLVECLRGLEHQISDLQGQVKDLEDENDELRNNAPKSAPTSNGAQMAELQAENEWLKSKHRTEIQELVSRIEDIENRGRMQQRESPSRREEEIMPSLKKESKKMQRSAAPPRAPPPQQRQEPQPKYVEDSVPIIEIDEDVSLMKREKRSVQRSVRVVSDKDAVRKR
jgi:hypothetical protein